MDSVLQVPSLYLKASEGFSNLTDPAETAAAYRHDEPREPGGNAVRAITLEPVGGVMPDALAGLDAFSTSSPT